MTLQSLKGRLDRIRARLLPTGSMAWRIDRLPPRLAESHETWREQCAAIARTFGDDGALYEAILDGRDPLPPMPPAVERALYPEGLTGQLPADTTPEEAATAYQSMLEG